jgi:hypothetical protein
MNFFLSIGLSTLLLLSFKQTEIKNWVRKVTWSILDIEIILYITELPPPVLEGRDADNALSVIIKK